MTRKPTKPTRASRLRRLETKAQHGALKASRALPVLDEAARLAEAAAEGRAELGRLGVDHIVEASVAAIRQRRLEPHP